MGRTWRIYIVVCPCNYYCDWLFADLASYKPSLLLLIPTKKVNLQKRRNTREFDRPHCSCQQCIPTKENSVDLLKEGESSGCFYYLLSSRIEVHFEIVILLIDLVGDRCMSGALLNCRQLLCVLCDSLR